MIEIKKATLADMLMIYPLYRRAFPRCERKPFAMIMKARRENISDVFAIRDGKFCGLAITLNRGDLVLLDYFAISERLRGSGIGSRALRMMQDLYPGKRIFLEIETPDEGAKNNGERIRRKNFYLKNGLRDIDMSVRLFGVDMQILTFDCDVSFDEYFDIYRSVVGENLARKNLILKNEKL